MRWFMLLFNIVQRAIAWLVRPRKTPKQPPAMEILKPSQLPVVQAVPPERAEGMPGQLTKNFNLSEFSCRDGSDVPSELLDNAQSLADNLQILREQLGKPIRVISGYRSPAYNRKIGGARRSQHMLAKAADIKVAGLTPTEVKAAIEALIAEGAMKKGGVGLYKTFTHYDVRGRNARWYGKGMKDDRP